MKQEALQREEEVVLKVVPGEGALPEEAGSDTILKTNAVTAVFDGFYALTDVDVAVKRNTIHFLIGPNGAGKTTLLDIICARTKPTSGTVHFYPQDGRDIRLTGVSEYKIVNLGVGRKFQVPSIFPSLTVMENMILSLKGGKGILAAIRFKLRAEDRERIEALLARVGLLARKDVLAGSLAHGEKQWLEISMQLLAQPELIMLDEPVAGMGKTETTRTAEILREIKKDCTVIVVEHDMEFVKQAADTVTVLHEGKVLIEGDIETVLSDENVQAVYLGRGGDRNS
jgi:urea transport system ATP-binding protein